MMSNYEITPPLRRLLRRFGREVERKERARNFAFVLEHYAAIVVVTVFGAQLVAESHRGDLFLNYLKNII